MLDPSAPADKMSPDHARLILAAFATGKLSPANYRRWVTRRLADRLRWLSDLHVKVWDNGLAVAGVCAGHTFAASADSHDIDALLRHVRDLRNEVALSNPGGAQ